MIHQIRIRRMNHLQKQREKKTQIQKMEVTIGVEGINEVVAVVQKDEEGEEERGRENRRHHSVTVQTMTRRKGEGEEEEEVGVEEKAEERRRMHLIHQMMSDRNKESVEAENEVEEEVV